jgi:hypothetical protein
VTPVAAVNRVPVIFTIVPPAIGPLLVPRALTTLHVGRPDRPVGTVVVVVRPLVVVVVGTVVVAVEAVVGGDEVVVVPEEVVVVVGEAVGGPPVGGDVTGGPVDGRAKANPSAADVAEVPPSVITVRSTIPLPAGDVALIEVAEVTL